MPEGDSHAVGKLRRRFRPPFVLTHLHRVELATAWQLKVFRHEISAGAAAVALEDLRTDIEGGFWLRPVYDLDAVHDCAQRLALEHAATLGTRTLDILHVACALELGVKSFVTRDDRQARLAAAVRLRVVVP